MIYDNEIRFNFRSPKIIFGNNSLEKVPELCRQFGNKGFLITGRSFKRNPKIFPLLIDQFKEKKIEIILKLKKLGEPTIVEVDELTKAANKEKIDWIIGIGGGGTLDLAKAVAGLATNEGSAADYQKGKSMINDALPFIAVPTTAGTGSEITNNAVLIDNSKNIKKSIRGDSMLSNYAVYNPLLTLSMPSNITANTGMDALTQAIESYVSKSRNALSDYFAERSIELIIDNIQKAYDNGENLNARENMLYGSMLSALSFSNAKLGAVHGFAHPIGVIHNIPHGLICGVLLPHVMEFNLGGNLPHVTKKYAWIAKKMNRNLTGSEYDLAKKSIDNIFSMLENLQIPKTITGLGIKKNQISAIVNDTKGSSLANNPRETNKESLTKILEDAL
ncbi:MAG: iron-containing alcohol dehydrogenase family protein [Promethearchaeota archaeon]